MTAAFDRRAIPSDARIHQWTAPDGWPLRSFAWPAEGAPRGSILFQGGRGDILERYLESFDNRHGPGSRIDSRDWRGQGGSGRQTASKNCGNIKNFATYVAVLRAFYWEWVAATPGPHVVMG